MKNTTPEQMQTLLKLAVSMSDMGPRQKQLFNSALASCTPADTASLFEKLLVLVSAAK